jgi:hypothetical protein
MTCDAVMVARFNSLTPEAKEQNIRLANTLDELIKAKGFLAEAKLKWETVKQEAEQVMECKIKISKNRHTDETEMTVTPN